MPEMRNDAEHAAHGYKCDSRCKCGQYPGHLELDKAYLNNEISLQEYADRVGCKSRSSVERHVKGHLPDALLKARDIKDVANADSLLDELKKARERTYSLLDKAEAAANTKVYGVPVAYLREIREQLKFMAELEGRLATQNDPKPFHIRLRWYDEVKDETKYDS